MFYSTYIFISWFLPLQITQGDRLSSQICHACISYLNSWQSFKNRCIASQNKQRVWLGLPKSTTITLAKPHPQNHHQQQNQQHNVSVPANNKNNQYQQNGSPKKSGYVRIFWWCWCFTDFSIIVLFRFLRYFCSQCQYKSKRNLWTRSTEMRTILIHRCS